MLVRKCVSMCETVTLIKFKSCQVLQMHTLWVRRCIQMLCRAWESLFSCLCLCLCLSLPDSVGLKYSISSALIKINQKLLKDQVDSLNVPDVQSVAVSERCPLCCLRHVPGWTYSSVCFCVFAESFFSAVVTFQPHHSVRQNIEG